MCQHVNLKSEMNTFRVLGITFSVNLNDMPILNYDTITTEVERTLVPWRQRKFTPVGKKILKTFIIPRLTTLFMMIPRPSPQTIKSLNKLFYSFIWDYKPDKISRVKLTQSYPREGLKMTDIDVFITRLKISWIKRLLSNDTPVWKTLGLHCIKNPIRLKYFGSIWLKNLAQNIINTVWKEALQSWAFLLSVNTPDENRKLSSPVWYNTRISKIEFLPQRFSKGIIFVNDLIDSQGKFLTYHELMAKYSVHYNFLEYHRVKQCVNSFLGKSDTSINERPIYPVTLYLLSKGIKGSREFYKILLSEKCFNDDKLRHKWKRSLNIEITKKTHVGKKLPRLF